MSLEQWAAMVKRGALTVDILRLCPHSVISTCVTLSKMLNLFKP